jgi:hypothetical protein
LPALGCFCVRVGCPRVWHSAKYAISFQD